METSVGIAVEEYLRTNYDHDMDYVDGKLVERDVGERKHSRLRGLLVALLMASEVQVSLRSRRRTTGQATCWRG